MANLLTQNEKKILARRDRLTIVLVYILGLLFILVISGVFLIPSYFLSKYKLEGAENRLELLKASISAQKNEEINDILENTKSLLSALEEGYADVSMDATIAQVISYAPQTVSITNMSLENSGVSVNLNVRGTAATRDGMLRFVDALKEDQNFVEVNLPIGVLAQDTDINFSLTFKTR